MIDLTRWTDLKKEEDLAAHRAGLVMISPESYDTEEVWDAAIGLLEAQSRIDREMRRIFDEELESDLERLEVYYALADSGVESPEYWFDLLLADPEPEYAG